MGMIGLQTERVSPPNDPEAWMVLRTALAPAICEEAREFAEDAGMVKLQKMQEALGPDMMQKMWDRLEEGADPETLADELNADVETAADDGAADAEDSETAAPPDGEDQSEDDEESQRARFDLDYAAAKLVRSWSYQDRKERMIQVKRSTVRMLDEDTREWLHDKAWAAMRSHIPARLLEGNS